MLDKNDAALSIPLASVAEGVTLVGTGVKYTGAGVTLSGGNRWKVSFKPEKKQKVFRNQDRLFPLYKPPHLSVSVHDALLHTSWESCFAQPTNTTKDDPRGNKTVCVGGGLKRSPLVVSRVGAVAHTHTRRNQGLVHVERSWPSSACTFATPKWAANKFIQDIPLSHSVAPVKLWLLF